MNKYIDTLNEIGVVLESEYINAATKNTYKCKTCNHVWLGMSASSVIKHYREYGTNTCPQCRSLKNKNRSNEIKNRKINELLNIGYEFINDIDDNNILLKHVICSNELKYNITTHNIKKIRCGFCVPKNDKTIKSIDPYLDSLNKVNITLISPFTNIKDKHIFKCNTCDHTFSGIITQKIKRKNPCPKCANKHLSNIKIQQTYINRLEKKCNITIIGDFLGASKHHTLKCLVCEHQWVATPSSKIRANKLFKHNSGCPVCSQNRREKHKYNASRQKNIDTIINRGFLILSDYDGRRNTNITVQNTTCGHEFVTHANNLIIHDINCPTCNNEIKRERCIQQNDIRSEQYLLTSNEWNIYKSIVSSKTRKSYIQHTNIINPNNYNRVKAGEKDGYQLDHIMSVKYCFDNQIPSTVCSHYTNLQMLPWGENISKSKNCGDIPDIFKPLQKYDNIRDWLINEINNLGVKYELNNNTLVDDVVIDIVFPDIKKGIILCTFDEYYQQYLESTTHNLYIHTTAVNNGYRIYQIYQDEWILNHSLVIKKIKHLLNINTQTTPIHARKCIINHVNSHQKRDFLNAHHLQGDDYSQINLGAYYNNELVAVMTFCKPRIIMNRKNSENVINQTYELSRFATNTHYRIPGIASKLLRHFEDNHEYDYIYSYADVRWSDGNVYEKLGFTLDRINRPTYHYVIGGDRVHRWGYRKDALKDLFYDYDDELTEYKNMLNHNIDRVWDCGNMKYVKYKTNT